MSENNKIQKDRLIQQIGQKKDNKNDSQQGVIVQPGDAYYHMLRASELDKKQPIQLQNKDQIYNSRKVIEGKEALYQYYHPQLQQNQIYQNKQPRIEQKEQQMQKLSKNQQNSNSYGKGSHHRGHQHFHHSFYPHPGFFNHEKRSFQSEFQQNNQFGNHFPGASYPYPPHIPPPPPPQNFGNMGPNYQFFGPPPMWNQGFSPYHHRHHGKGHGQRQFYHCQNSKFDINEGSVNGPNVECRRKWKHKYGNDQEFENKKYWRKGKRSRSHSSSSSKSSSDEEMNEKKKAYLMQIQAHYKSLLTGFFESRSINQIQRQKIIKFLRDKFPKYDAPVDQILKNLEILQAQNLLIRMPYIKVIKVLVKFKFNLTYATPKIMRIQEKKIKKYESDLKFQSKYGNLQVPPQLDHDSLINMDQSKVLYLIDGNNILPTHKDFRKYFQSNSENQRIQAKLRCQWLISYAINKQGCFLFFDGYADIFDIEKVSSYLYPNEAERQKAQGVRVIYSEQMSADDRIVEKLKSLVDQKENRQIILVSSDRDLYMRCIERCKINHTGGRYFFKFLKYRSTKQNKQQKQIKKKIKAIIKYKY